MEEEKSEELMATATLLNERDMREQSPQSGTEIKQSKILKQASKEMVTLDRAAITRSKAAFFCATFILLDVGKQLASYSITYFNKGRYPLPQTVIVAIIELIKFIVMFSLMFREKLWSRFRISFVFCIPSVIYTLNNNLFFYALHYTTPPVWLILIQSRVIMTALVYRLLFKRVVTPVQWFALFLLIASIVLSRLMGDSSGGSSTTAASLAGGMSNVTIAVLLSVVSAALSVSASVYTEFLFKNDKRHFVEQQLQLYMFSAVVAVGLCAVDEVQHNHTKTLLSELETYSGMLLTLVVLTLLLTSAGGLAVAAIVKNMDNIVKIYLAALGNMLTAVMSSLLFPDRFKMDTIFIAALALMFLAIYLYEKKVFTDIPAPISNIATSIYKGLIDKTLVKYLIVPGVLLTCFLVIVLSYHGDMGGLAGWLGYNSADASLTAGGRRELRAHT